MGLVVAVVLGVMLGCIAMVGEWRHHKVTFCLDGNVDALEYLEQLTLHVWVAVVEVIQYKADSHGGSTFT